MLRKEFLESYNMHLLKIIFEKLYSLLHQENIRMECSYGNQINWLPFLPLVTVYTIHF